jgi:hypothetical protein
MSPEEESTMQFGKSSSSGLRGICAIAALAASAWFCASAHAAQQNYTIECTGGPDAEAIYQYSVDSYKRAVRMAKLVGKEIKDKEFLLDGKPGNSVKFIDDKLIMVYRNEELNTYTIVLPVFGGKGNMKIGNVANEKEHPDGCVLSCARK